MTYNNQNSRNDGESNKPTHVVKVRDGSGKKATYERIGVGWENEDDGSLYIRVHGHANHLRWFHLLSDRGAVATAAGVGHPAPRRFSDAHLRPSIAGIRIAHVRSNPVTPAVVMTSYQTRFQLG